MQMNTKQDSNTIMSTTAKKIITGSLVSGKGIFTPSNLHFKTKYIHMWLWAILAKRRVGELSHSVQFSVTVKKENERSN